MNHEELKIEIQEKMQARQEEIEERIKGFILGMGKVEKS